MVSGGVATPIGEIQVLRNKESPFLLSGGPDVRIRAAREVLFRNRLDVMPSLARDNKKSSREILVELDLHATEGVAGMGKSSSADTAAKAMTARTAASSRVGSSRTLVAPLRPSASLASTVRTVTRVPLTIGSPPQIPGSRTM